MKDAPCPTELPGEPLSESHPIFPYLPQLSERPGWHFEDKMAIQVVKQAKSFRSPLPRIDVKLLPFRSTFGRFDHPAGASEWRLLEEDAELHCRASRKL